MEEKIKEIVEGLNEYEKEKLKAEGYTNTAFFNQDGTLTEHYKWYSKDGKKYIKLDCGGSGAFMVEKETGEIFNIKAYGQIDKNKKLKADIGNIYSVDVRVLHSKRYNYLR